MRLLPMTLRLRSTFRIAHGASDTRSTMLLDLGDGWGEAAPVSYHGESLERVREWLEHQSPQLTAPREPGAIRALLARLPQGSRAARAAVDLALHDALGRRLGLPLRTLLGLDGLPLPPTSFTLAIDTPETLAEAARAAAWPVLKVKLGGPEDLRSVEVIRAAAPQSRLRVDANGGWDLATARKLIPALIELGVELIEQPLAISDRDGYHALKRERYAIPILADEPIRNAADVADWAGLVDGVNIKLMKTGGIAGALEAIAVARAHDLRVMLGCMIETSLGVAGAAAIAGLADWIDLDGPLLIANDPGRGLSFDGAQIIPPAGAGLGVTIDEAAVAFEA